MAKQEPDNETEQPLSEIDDPVLSMLGVGKQLWKAESGDGFVERLRSEEDLPPPPFGGALDDRSGD